MQLAKEVKTFSSACEHILSAISMDRPLSFEEAAMIEYYCKEIQTKIAPILAQTERTATAARENGAEVPADNP